MNAKYRFIDRKGRLTIPYALRVKHGITQNTLFAVRENDDGTLSLRQQRVVDATQCPDCQVVEKETSLLDFINSLKPTEQKAVFRYLAHRLSDEVDG